ncbi:MAG: Gfo/Idh/MocA family oxidoreductase [Bacillota bacterium]|nr:Gfo/Idh/MocA family oxidoreductase [Bacillota bacterium]
MINVLFAGCGRISDLHALGYENNPDAKIYGLFDPDTEKAENKSNQWKAEKVYPSYAEALADPAITLVEILTPHHLHCEMAVEAAKAGKHVSLQKPMAMSLEEADRIIEAAEKNRITLRIYENFVYYPPYVKARDLIMEGAIGDPLSFNLRVRCGFSPNAWDIPIDSWQWRFNPKTGGGCPVMFDHNYHNFSLALFLLGPVEKIAAWTGETEVIQDSGLTVDTPAAVIWKYKNKSTIGLMDVVMAPELIIDSNYYADESRLEITGTRGIIFVNRCTGQLQNRPPVELYAEGITTSYEHIPAGWEESFKAATRDMIDSIMEGRQPRLSGKEGRDALAMTLAAGNSASSGQTVYLDSPAPGKVDQADD